MVCRPANSCPPDPFFFNVRELIAREGAPADPLVDMRYYQATQAHLQIQHSIPDMIMEGLRDWIDWVPSQFLVASEVVTFRRGHETFNRRLWHTELRDLEVKTAITSRLDHETVS